MGAVDAGEPDIANSKGITMVSGTTGKVPPEGTSE
jgi:hypothetical protein